LLRADLALAFSRLASICASVAMTRAATWRAAPCRHSNPLAENVYFACSPNLIVLEDPYFR
jgi:hypothetical protein